MCLYPRRRGVLCARSTEAIGAPVPSRPGRWLGLPVHAGAQRRYRGGVRRDRRSPRDPGGEPVSRARLSQRGADGREPDPRPRCGGRQRQAAAQAPRDRGGSGGEDRGDRRDGDLQAARAPAQGAAGRRDRAPARARARAEARQGALSRSRGQDAAAAPPGGRAGPHPRAAGVRAGARDADRRCGEAAAVEGAALQARRRGAVRAAFRRLPARRARCRPGRGRRQLPADARHRRRPRHPRDGESGATR